MKKNKRYTFIESPKSTKNMPTYKDEQEVAGEPKIEEKDLEMDNSSTGEDNLIVDKMDSLPINTAELKKIVILYKNRKIGSLAERCIEVVDVWRKKC